MILTIQDRDTAINQGFEELARLQVDVAKRSRVGGDVSIYNKRQMMSLKLLAFIEALSYVPFNHSKEQNAIIYKLYSRIKLITKDLRQWN